MECQSETADLFPATVIITTGDEALTLPKHEGNERSKWQCEKGAMSAHVSLIVKALLKRHKTLSCYFFYIADIVKGLTGGKRI